MSSQPSIAWPSNAMYNQGPMIQKKRKRYDDTEEDYSSPTSQNQRMRVAEYPMDAQQRAPFGHRPAFPNISEHEGYEDSYAPSHPTMHEGYHRQQPMHISPLPAPTPQRYNAQSMAAQLENYGQARPGELRRPVHKRSQSDMGAIYNAQPAYRFPPRHEEEQMGIQPQQYYEEPAPRRYYSPPGFYTQSHPMQQQHLPHGHIRHQSTPLLARPYEVSPRFQPHLAAPGPAPMGYCDRR
jgi:hypothetical protein